MASKDSEQIPVGSGYNLGDYSFRIERSSVPGSSNDSITAICSKGGKNARKSIQVPSSTQVLGWYVEANETEATVYVSVKSQGDDWDADSTISSAGASLGSNGRSQQQQYNYVKANAGKAIAVWNQRSGNNGLPYLYSKDGAAARINPGAFYSATSSAGEVWYFGTGFGEQGPGSNSAGLPVVSYRKHPPIDAILSAFNYRNNENEETLLVGRFAIDIGDAGGDGPGSDWTDPGDYDPDWEEGDPTHTLYVTVTGALSGRHNDPIVDPSYSYIPADKYTVKDYGCGGDGGHGGGGGAGASTVVIHKFATNQANSKEVTAIARRHGYGSGGGKGGKGGDGCILVYY